MKYRYSPNHELAIKVHPDKNKAPGADEAFKKVRNRVISEGVSSLFDIVRPSEETPVQRFR